jgi:poly(A) polymerase
MKNLITILESKNAVSILMDLYNTGELFISFPELVNLKKSQDENGHKDNFVHTLQVLQNAIDFNYSIEIKLTALFHDLGKVQTKRKQSGKWTFHNHENVSAEMVKMLFNRFELPNELYNKVYLMVKYHGQPQFTQTESAIKRLALNLEGHFEDLINFCKCDLTSKYENKNNKIRKELHSLYNYKLTIDSKLLKESWRPPINANDIMSILNITDGKKAGEIKNIMIEKIKDNTLKEDVESCTQWVNDNYKFFVIYLANYNVKNVKTIK